MIDYHRATMHLRFVERVVSVADQTMFGGGPMYKTVRILQQKWEPTLTGDKEEWRDIPLEKE